MITTGQELKNPPGRILVVDDDPNVVGVLKYVLQQQGFEVHGAPDGLSALAAFRGGRFDMIFTDFSMPRMTGLELAALVRKLDPDIPIILITGHAHALDPEAVARAGLSRVLAKPFQLDELLACLSLLTASQSTQR